MNQLYYGDNLDVLRRYIKDESVDLIYLDPPFNSKRNYNIIYRDGTSDATAQVQAFEDTWAWNDEAESAFHEVVTASPNNGAREFLASMQRLIGKNDMLAYLSMMTIRLVELKRVLKPNGSIYLHCDPTMSHYLKVLMDSIFGAGYFRTEIIWQRTTAHNDAKQGRKQHGRIHDTILFFTKSNEWQWNSMYTEYSEDYLKKMYRHIEPETGRRYRLDNLTGPGGASKGNPQYEVMGVTRYWRYSRDKMAALIKEGRIVQSGPGKVPAYKRYLDEMPGVVIQDVWTDIPNIGSITAEAMLERIIGGSSNEGDVVLDPFCGCGTTVVAAQHLKRKWIGIDVTHLAIGLVKSRLVHRFDHNVLKHCKVIGEPTDLAGARQLADDDKYQFQYWALGLVGARPDPSMEKKGADGGIDGKRLFIDNTQNEVKTILFSVKGGGSIPSTAVRDLSGTVLANSAQMGVLISIAPYTKKMKEAAAAAGRYDAPNGKSYPRIQLFTVEELLDGQQIDMPSALHAVDATIKISKKKKSKDSSSSLSLDL